jgi:hypothetical protein
MASLQSTSFTTNTLEQLKALPQQPNLQPANAVQSTLF